VGKDDIFSYNILAKVQGVYLIHELLDEFINYFVTKRVNDKSPQKDKVYYMKKSIRKYTKTNK
jgi:hypothetical protein